VTVVKTCTQCGAVNNAEADTCCFCDTRLSPNTRQNSVLAAARPKAPQTVSQTEGNLAVAPDWRNEVASRMEAYRVRRKHLGSDPSQPEFLFDDNPHETAAPEASAPRAPSKLAAPTAQPAQAAPAVQPRQQRSSPPAPERVVNVDRVPGERMPVGSFGVKRAPAERVDIDVAQPALDFGAGAYILPLDRPSERPWNRPSDRNSAGCNPASPPQESSGSPAVFDVAPLAERRRAALLDAALLLFAYGGFLALFAVLGGRFAFSLFDVGVVASTIVLFYAQYVALFTFFGGATPGMMLRHLRVASFDGADPTQAQLLWRSFGYLLSAGTLMLGFLSALWDRDHLCWHDRISQTYLTSAEQSSSGAASAQSAPDFRPQRD
jgi:uncharacterized RDD family membrane protein YckC